MFVFLSIMLKIGSIFQLIFFSLQYLPKFSAIPPPNMMSAKNGLILRKYEIHTQTKPTIVRFLMLFGIVSNVSSFSNPAFLQMFDILSFNVFTLKFTLATLHLFFFLWLWIPTLSGSCLLAAGLPGPHSL